MKKTSWNFWPGCNCKQGQIFHPFSQSRIFPLTPSVRRTLGIQHFPLPFSSQLFTSELHICGAENKWWLVERKTKRERGSEGWVQKGFRLTHEGLLGRLSAVPTFRSPSPHPCPRAPPDIPASVPPPGKSADSHLPYSASTCTFSDPALIMDLSIAHFTSSFFNHIFHSANRKTRPN